MHSENGKVMQINSEVSTQIPEHKYSRSTIRFGFDSGKGNQTKITPARYCTQIAVLIIVDIQCTLLALCNHR